jgi:hypothetical protein
MVTHLAPVQTPARSRRKVTPRATKSPRIAVGLPKTGHLIRTGFTSPYLVRVIRWIE